MPLLPLALRRDPLDVLACLATEPGALCLDVPDAGRPLTLVGCRPVDELRVPPDAHAPLHLVGEWIAAAPVAADVPFPWGAGVVAVLAYELGAAVAPRPVAWRAARPLAVLRRYDPLLVHDRMRQQWWLAVHDPSRARAPWLGRLAAPVPRRDGALAAAPLAAGWPRDRYVDAAGRVLDLIAAGDCYQVNLTQPFATRLVGPPWRLHCRLQRSHPVPYAAYVDLGDVQVVGNSPEQLLRRRGRAVETRPIKGTRPRGDDAAGDAALALELRRDAKELAEHVMIVDLERNDLGRVCAPGGVRVADFAAVERHASVQHLVSRVCGTLRDGVGLADLLGAVFPGGSITGAPKQRAMEIIADLEREERGVYTGAIGLLHPSGDCELGLPIRTAVIERNELVWRAGGGIVADSTPERELAEAWLKTVALRRALGDVDDESGRCSSG